LLLNYSGSWSRYQSFREAKDQRRADGAAIRIAKFRRPARVPAELGDIRPAASVKATHAYSQPGTYFPVLRATSQRESDAKTPYARIQNLGRVRVIVK
jgi:hypothetical protein